VAVIFTLGWDGPRDWRVLTIKLLALVSATFLAAIDSRKQELSKQASK
jgi:hypothetical protein